MTEDTVTQKSYLTVAEVATHLRLSPMSVYRMVHDGKFAGTIATGVKGTTIRIPAESVTAHERDRLWAAATEAIPLIPGQLSVVDCSGGDSCPGHAHTA